MTDNRKKEKMGQESKVKKVITTIMCYLCKCIIKIIIGKIIDILIK